MGDQWVGKNLALTIDGDPVTCPQSFSLNGKQDFVEFYCPATDGKQKVYDGTNWDGSCVWFPENDDHADLTDFNNSTAAAVIVYPDGNTSGRIKITFSAYTAISLDTQRSSPGSSTITFNIDGDVTFAAATGS